MECFDLFLEGGGGGCQVFPEPLFALFRFSNQGIMDYCR